MLPALRRNRNTEGLILKSANDDTLEMIDKISNRWFITICILGIIAYITFYIYSPPRICNKFEKLQTKEEVLKLAKENNWQLSRTPTEELIAIDINIDFGFKVECLVKFKGDKVASSRYSLYE